MKKILLIEDEKRTIMRLIERLTENYHVDVVEDVTGAIESLAKDKYDLVFLDIMLPHMDEGVLEGISPKKAGVEILRMIREGKTKSPSNIPVVVLTAVSESSVLDKIKSLNPTRLWTKPRETNIIYEYIKGLLD